MFLGLLYPHPDSLVTSFDPGPAPDFYHQSKILRKTFIYTICDFLSCDFLSLKNDINVPVFRIRIRICAKMSRIRNPALNVHVPLVKMTASFLCF
jgi:hypothetical protein